MPSATAAEAHVDWRDLVALTKPSVTMLNLVATAAGFWLAAPEGGALRFLFALIGTGLVVGSANALNCYLERDIDRNMARTRTRPLPAGRLAPNVALAFGLLLAAAGVPFLTFAVNPLTGLLSALALIGYVLIYTPMKQKSSLALIVGAVPGAAPPLIGWAAATGEVGTPGVLLFLLLFLWQIPHFLAITLFRTQDYARAGFKILPVERGAQATRRELVRYLLATVATSLAFSALGAASWLYLAAALVLGGAMLAQGLQGLREQAGPKWARNFFISTNLYLTLLLGALVLDRFVA